jgi:hypothetical protein
VQKTVQATVQEKSSGTPAITCNNSSRASHQDLDSLLLDHVECFSSLTRLTYSGSSSSISALELQMAESLQTGIEYTPNLQLQESSSNITAQSACSTATLQRTWSEVPHKTEPDHRKGDFNSSSSSSSSSNAQALATVYMAGSGVSRCAAGAPMLTGQPSNKKKTS